MTHVAALLTSGLVLNGALGSRIARVRIADAWLAFDRAAVVRREWASYDPRVLPRKEVKK